FRTSNRGIRRAISRRRLSKTIRTPAVDRSATSIMEVERRPVEGPPFSYHLTSMTFALSVYTYSTGRGTRQFPTWRTETCPLLEEMDHGASIGGVCRWCSGVVH